MPIFEVEGDSPKQKPPIPPKPDRYTSIPSTMKRNKVFIGVMGVTGAGKSTFIKAATGIEEIEIGHELTSCTPSVIPYPFTLPSPDPSTNPINPTPSTDVILIDTPGFNDTFKSESEVLKEIASYLEKTYRDSAIKLSGIIYMHALEDRRMSGSSLRNLKMFRQLCGETSMRNVVLCSSGWDLIEMTGQMGRGESKERELIDNAEFWGPMIAKGARSERFFNSRESALGIVRGLLGSAPVILQIQHELVEQQMDLLDTAAGTTVNEELAKLQAKYEIQLREIQDEMAAALKDRDEELREVLEGEKAKFERMRDDARRAQDSLRYEQRNLKRRHENEMQDLRLALETSRTDSMKKRKEDQEQLMRSQAERIAERMEFETVVKTMRAGGKHLRREERQAIEAEIKAAEAEMSEEERRSSMDSSSSSFWRPGGGSASGVNGGKLDAKAVAAKKARNKKRAYKLVMNVVGIVGSVTMSALGLGFLSGPFQGMIDFGSLTGGGGNEEDPAGGAEAEAEA